MIATTRPSTTAAEVVSTLKHHGFLVMGHGRIQAPTRDTYLLVVGARAAFASDTPGEVDQRLAQAVATTRTFLEYVLEGVR